MRPTRLIVLVAFFAGCGAEPAPRGPKFPIAKETTHITGPLDDQGYVDYAAALNAHYGRGVTPDNNANVALWRTIGPKKDHHAVAPEFFRAMGIEPPPAEGDYFTHYLQFVWETETNADLQSAASDEWYVHFQMKPWASGRYPHIAQWLTASELHLAKFAEAVRRPEFYNPILLPKTEAGRTCLMVVTPPGPQDWIEIGRAFARRALLNLGEGRPAEAWADVLNLYRLARLTARDPTVIGTMIGMSLEMQAAEVAPAYVSTASQSRDEWLACLRQIEALPRFPSIAEKLDRYERFLYLDLLQSLDRGDASAVGGLTGILAKASPETVAKYRKIDYEPALREGVVWFDRLVRAAAIADWNERIRAFEQLADETRKRDPDPARNPRGSPGAAVLTPDLTTGEAIGRRLLASLPLNDLNCTEVADLRTQVAANLRVALVLSAYHAEHGRYPASLSDIPPTPGVTTDDLYSGRSLIYRPLDDGFLLYSVGPNGRDDGGRADRDDRGPVDLSFRVARPKVDK